MSDADEDGAPAGTRADRAASVQARLASPEAGGEGVLGMLKEITPAGSIPAKVTMELLEHLFRDHPGCDFRAACREEIEEKDAVGDLVYGEVGMLALVHVLKRALPHCPGGGAGEVFYDLGSGGGRPVFGAALLYPELRRAVGLEIIAGVHALAEEVLGLYRAELQPHLPPAYEGQAVELECGDFLARDWSDATLVLANSTCFTQGLFDKMEARAAELLRPGAVFVTLSKSFQGGGWEIIESFERRMSWGSAAVHIHRKVKGAPPEEERGL